MDQEAPRGFRRVRAWQAADRLASAVYDAFGQERRVPRWLVDQVCRSAVSVPANIAEGYGRGAIGDYIRFLTIARGSLAETEYYVLFATKHALLPEGTLQNLAHLVHDTGTLLFPLIRGLVEKQREGTWNRNHAVGEDSVSYDAFGSAVLDAPGPADPSFPVPRSSFQ